MDVFFLQLGGRRKRTHKNRQLRSKVQNYYNIIKLEPTLLSLLNISDRSSYSRATTLLIQMIGLVTKFSYVSMTFKMLHKHDKKWKKKHVVKADVTRCHHKKLIKNHNRRMSLDVVVPPNCLALTSLMLRYNRVLLYRLKYGCFLFAVGRYQKFWM
jgi:hypothetical protein